MSCICIPFLKIRLYLLYSIYDRLRSQGKEKIVEEVEEEANIE